jgi:hypothetical protein
MSAIVRMPAASSAPRAWLVLAICISASAPSCIRAPPEAVTISSGVRSRSAVSAAWVIRSPTSAPRLPPRKAKSITAATKGCPPIVPRTHSTASARPVAARAAARRAGYGWESTNASGSPPATARSSGVTDSGSKSCRIRCAALSRSCRLHSGQTWPLRANRLRYTMIRQPEHRCQSAAPPSGSGPAAARSRRRSVIRLWL